MARDSLRDISRHRTTCGQRCGVTDPTDPATLTPRHSHRRGARGGVDATQNSGNSEASELEVLWPGIVDSLPPNQRVWLPSSKPLMLAESTAVVAVPNEFTRNQLEGRLRTRIEDTLSERLGKPVRLAVSVDETLEGAEPDQPAPTHPGMVSGPGAAAGTRPGQDGPGASRPLTASAYTP